MSSSTSASVRKLKPTTLVMPSFSMPSLFPLLMQSSYEPPCSHHQQAHEVRSVQHFPPSLAKLTLSATKEKVASDFPGDS